MPDVILTDDARRLDLEQQKKRAKELRRDLAAADSAAVARFRKFHPKADGLRDDELVADLAKVSEAQLVIARELGLPSWPKLRRHIERWRTARAEIESGAPPVDRELPTTHIRCGTDIQEGLQRAGIRGSFQLFCDPYCQGPVLRDGDLIDIRARFVADTYGVPFEEARKRHLDELHALRDTITHKRVVLWFEHDSFDQLILARILAFYAELGAPARLELVCIDAFPAVDRFNGLGQLSPTALRMLWDDRRPVSSDLLALGTRTWEAVRDPDPRSLYTIVRSCAALPQMGRAVQRHLQELPWTRDGLSLTQHLTLEILSGGAMQAGRLFRTLNLNVEPLTFLGDAMYWVVLEELLHARKPAIQIDEGPLGEHWRERIVSLTDVGYQLLDESIDWMECGPAERWVGGVRLVAGKPSWRWDDKRAAPVPS